MSDGGRVETLLGGRVETLLGHTAQAGSLYVLDYMFHLSVQASLCGLAVAERSTSTSDSQNFNAHEKYWKGNACPHARHRRPPAVCGPTSLNQADTWLASQQGPHPRIQPIKP